jgi:hypothetical protein
VRQEAYPQSRNAGFEVGECRGQVQQQALELQSDTEGIMKKIPLFEASQFTPTEFSTTEDKAKFANHFVAFVESDFSASKFPHWFYKRLSMCFGHIAHFNQGGFYETWFSSTASKVRFLKYTLDYGGYGDPRYTYSDVEQDLGVWLRESPLIETLQLRNAQEIEAEERRVLARLKAKYESPHNKLKESHS